MINVLVVSFQEAFSRAAGYQAGAFFTLVVAISEIKLLGSSAPSGRWSSAQPSPWHWARKSPSARAPPSAQTRSDDSA
jgi:hypothetical protein